MRKRVILKKGHAVIVTGIVLGASIIGVSFFLFGPLDQSGFQFEQSVTISTPDRIFFRIRANDANVSVTFEDRENLLFSINVTGYSDSSEAHVTYDKHSESWGIYLSTGRQESVDIVLGNGCFYYITFADSSNLNTTMIYSNNAWVNGSVLSYIDDDSDLTLRVHNDIKTTDTVGFTGTIMCRSLNLEIEPPYEWNGLVDFNDSNVTIMELSGWFELFSRYETAVDYEGNPSIELDVEVEQAFAWLRI